MGFGICDLGFSDSGFRIAATDAAGREGPSYTMANNALSRTMTVRDFENGYWYADQLKDLAVRIGIPAAKKLQKDELEKAVVTI